MFSHILKKWEEGGNSLKIYNHLIEYQCLPQLHSLGFFFPQQITILSFLSVLKVLLTAPDGTKQPVHGLPGEAPRQEGQHGVANW